MGAICPPIRRALIGAGGFLLLRGPLPEENIQKEDHLRPPRLRRRTVTESQASSGEHSLPGVGLLGAICPPIRRALIGAGGFLLLRGSLPEENIQNEDHLRPLRLRRSTATHNASPPASIRSSEVICPARDYLPWGISFLEHAEKTDELYVPSVFSI
ncbi:hypothetical protein SDC9_146813 [bioreactor metagenome]|uniref:Uncharacterized protein n=1 Tax=bioreactor metagenome TaxID=1076179 RepID=A0A645EEB8_9ZZZZ